MPIQFLCRYCRQLLGISRSRAGSAVDCPACGRSLRVPHEHGNSPEPAADLPAADPTLLNALEILAASSSSAPTLSAPVSTPAAIPAPQLTARAARRPGTTSSPESPSAIAQPTALELLAQLPVSPVPVDAEQSLQPLILANPESDSDAQPTPDQLSPSSAKIPSAAVDPSLSALAEIALPANPSTHVGNQPRGSAPGRRLTSILGSLLLACTAFAAGYAFQSPTFPPENTSDQSPATRPENSTTPSPSPAAKQSPRPALTGKIYFRDPSGESRPDAGALLILVPRINSSTLKLDPRPLREAPDSTAHKALAAALAVLQVSFTTADASGNYSLPTPDEPSLQLIAISKHQLRNPDIPLSDSVRNTIEAWFDSAPHLTGKLATSVHPLQIRDTTAVEAPVITFDRP